MNAAGHMPPTAKGDGGKGNKGPYPSWRRGPKAPSLADGRAASRWAADAYVTAGAGSTRLRRCAGGRYAICPAAA